MPFDETIHHTPGLDLSARTFTRHAVRAVIRRGNELLLAFVEKNNEYKFPGGGVEPGETPAAALAREVREETGRTLATVGPLIGTVTEYERETMRDGHEIFSMVSEYYPVAIDAGYGTPDLDGYERDLGFRPGWVRIAEALAVNRKTMAARGERATRWIKRETLVLGILDRLWATGAW